MYYCSELTKLRCSAVAIAERAGPTEGRMSLYETVRAALGLFSKKQLLSSAQSLGPGGTARAKEAVFHFELYRCLKLVVPDVYPTPEFSAGKSKHDIDLYLGFAGWGIEVLVDGKGLKEHVSRFNTGGSYAKWGMIT